jgi:hypothetical protein
MASLAYAAMAASMLRTRGSIGQVLQPAFPWRAAEMATGNGWASMALAPLVVAGAVLLLRRNPASRGAVAGLVGVLLVQWAVLQSAALTTRFLVWLVPGAAYLVAVAIGRVRVGALLPVLACALGVAVMAPGFTREPTAYRQAAALIRRVDATGARSCVVDVGVSPMLAYLDSPADFAAVTEPAQLDSCDAVFVTALVAHDGRLVRPRPCRHRRGGAPVRAEEGHRGGPFHAGALQSGPAVLAIPTSSKG